MSFSLDDCTRFLEDLIMGDFNEDQMVSAQIIGGLISLIPVVDQVMDARDVSGNLYRINKQGGFQKATLDQKINLGFAAFGVVPEVGSAFKTVFKPLYKERKAVKGAINSGVAMIERMLSKKKGGALGWVKALDWAGNTQAAIVQANLALESCIALLDYIGQDHWWCPDRLQQLARDVAPGIRKLRGTLAAPIREAAGHIKDFITDLLGEHAAAVVLAVANNAASLPRGQHAGKPHQNGAGHARVADKPRLNGRATASKTATVVQRTAFQIYQALDHLAKGLVGEHIVDHHVIEQKDWGMDWNRHDVIGGPGKKPAGWQSTCKKLNDGGIPIYLCTPSATVVINGIDSLWKTNRKSPVEFAVVEAKASMNPLASLNQLLSEAQASQQPKKSGSGRKKTVGTAGKKKAGRAAPAVMTMQMSHDWITTRVKKDFAKYRDAILRGNGNYSRHVFLVSPIQADDHILALAKIVEHKLISNPAGAQKFAPEHSKHDVQKEFGEQALIDAEKYYSEFGKPKKGQKRKK